MWALPAGQSKPFKPSKLRKKKHMGYLTTEQVGLCLLAGWLHVHAPSVC